MAKLNHSILFRSALQHGVLSISQLGLGSQLNPAPLSKGLQHVFTGKPTQSSSPGALARLQHQLVL